MILKPEAAQDVVDAVQWYESQREGLGKRFRSQLDKVFEQIEAMTELHRIIYDQVRRTLTPGYPFAVYYRLDDDEIVVLAVVHSSRDPDRRKSRL